MFFPRRSIVMSPAFLSSFKWKETVEGVFSSGSKWQQTSPTVDPWAGRASPDSSTSTGLAHAHRNSKICKRVGSPSALNAAERSLIVSIIGILHQHFDNYRSI